MSRQESGDVWSQLLANESPDLDFRSHPDTGDSRDIIAALIWDHPLDDLKTLPNLRLVASLGAGVDHIVDKRELIPPGVQVTRIVDPAMTEQMTEWCIMAMLTHLRSWEQYRELQQQRQYTELHDIRIPQDVTVGVLGLGVMGGHCAGVLAAMGYRVRGWSRSPRTIDNVACFDGMESMKAFLQPCDVVICLLPLTNSTRNILNRESLSWVQPGCYVINAGRGQHIVEEDLIAAIDDGHISGAALDVQREEPMNPNNPLWFHPKIKTFPHIAAFTIPRTCVPQIAENYRRLVDGEPLINTVDLDREY